MEERLLVIDTDAGIDDTLALLISLRAHKDPKISWKVLAITCVNGNTGLDNVCINVTRVLEVAGASEIPIFRGAERGLVHRIEQNPFPYHGLDGFGDAEFPKISPKLEKEHAVLELIRLAHLYEGNVTVVAIGPLTNIAMAINLDPSFSKSIKELCVMGGNVQGVGNIAACAEFNFWADPEAAYVVLASQFVQPILIVPWETCKFEARSELKWRTGIMGQLNTSESDLMNKIEEKILSRNERVHLGWVSCDALVPSIMLNPKVIKATEKHYCTVELTGTHSRGQMILDHTKRSGKPDNVIAVTKIDLDLYQKMILWGLGGENLDLNF